ncbi:uncharacterized protein LOC6577384 [Drosophila mojavensis]|uniref:SHSP domain-containing protein n=1 Tax=Drosophila mojavensis TaxID=7230 RepID=B4KL43_DROMO|nr:uncharacterized protein LOC6577384 [Drosophila mojavensis]EDW12793.1 uncharacterized protein Dmoj_GI17865 [Drosophila mojavensis]
MVHFDVMRLQYEKRIGELERQVLECSQMLQQLKEDTVVMDLDEQKPVSYVQTETHLCWQFDMHEFPLHNIRVELRDRRVKLRAYHDLGDQYEEVSRQFELPEHANTVLSAKLGITGILTIQAPIRIQAD